MEIGKIKSSLTAKSQRRFVFIATLAVVGVPPTTSTKKLKMHISFDLDSTLIPHGNEFEAEKRNLFASLLGIEPIRLGTSQLISDLQKQGHTLHIYTTSFRSKFKIRLMLFYYGIKVGKIINQSQNQRTLKKRNKNASKYPPAFGFELHIDDSKGVEMEGTKLNFKTIIIKTNDKNWIETIKKEITSK